MSSNTPMAIYLKAWRLKHPGYKVKECRAWRKKNPEISARASRKWRDSLRREMVDAYGRKCVCCEESHYEFLTLEHVRRDGHIHRKQFGSLVNLDLRRRGWPKGDYTLLCWNCNLVRRYGNKCPHENEGKLNVLAI